jgi:hypothetical protein
MEAVLVVVVLDLLARTQFLAILAVKAAMVSLEQSLASFMVVVAVEALTQTQINLVL